jgi:hypothetical protein
MPEVPKRGWPEAEPQPSPEQMQMAAAQLAQRGGALDEVGVEALRGASRMINAERFHEAQRSWPESKNIEYLKSPKERDAERNAWRASVGLPPLQGRER